MPGNQGINDGSPVISDLVFQTRIIHTLLPGSFSPGQSELGPGDLCLEWILF